MKTGKILSAFFASLLLLFISFNISAQKNADKPYHDNIVIVKIKPEYINEVEKSEMPNIISKVFPLKSSYTLQKEFPFTQIPDINKNYESKIPDITNIYRITYANYSDPVAIAAELFKTGYFEYAEPLYKIELCYVPNDPMNQTDQYWLFKTKAFEAWDIHQGDTNIVIGISDTGIELSHPELIYQIKYNYNDPLDGIDNDLDGYIDNFRGWNFAENNNNVATEASDHGTWVSGIAGAATDNATGVSGAGYKCMILPLKIMNSAGVIENAYQSIVYAAEHNCDVINCSWGSSYYQKMAQDVINYAVLTHDLLVVSASGNTNSDLKYYPASYENVLSVAGTQTEDQKWSPDNSIAGQGSTYSYYVDVCAPATNFKSTGPWSGYTLMWGGTSFACPIVAGFAGILRSYYPDYNATQIEELIKAGCDIIDTIPYNAPFAGKLGKGRVNLFNALTISQPPAVVFHNISTNENEMVVQIEGEFTNYLSDATNLVITAEILNEYASIPNSEVFSGTLSTLESASGIIINIVLAENIPHDYKIILKLNYIADEYESEQVLEFNVNPGFKNIKTDNLTLSVTSDGRLGYSDNNSTIGEGFVYDNLYPLFYDCGIISGSSAVNLYSSVRQNTDFSNETFPEVIESEFADNYIRTEISDSNDVSPIGLFITQDVYSWDGAENSNFFIIDYSLINKSIYDIENFHFGLFTDWDLINSAANSAVFDETTGFMYCRSDNPQDMNAGFKLLSNQIPKNYALLQTENGDGIIDITDGFLDIEKFHMIANSTNGLTESPSDIVIYSGAGPFSIAAGDTVIVGFALIASPSIYNINSAIERSSDIYNDVLHPQNVHQPTASNCEIYPNPVASYFYVNTNDNATTKFNISIYNIAGEEVFKTFAQNNDKIDVSGLIPSLYFVKVWDGNKEYVKKVTVLGK